MAKKTPAPPENKSQEPGGNETKPDAGQTNETQPAGGAPAPGAEGENKEQTLTMIETTAEKSAAEAEVKAFSQHLVEAARDAATKGNAAAHADLENLLVRLHDFKSRLDTIEDHIEGEAQKVWKRIKEIL